MQVMSKVRRLMWYAEYEDQFHSWEHLSVKQREEFFIGEEYLPLPPTHADRIRVLHGAPARELIKKALVGFPGYSSTATSKFTREESILLTDVWNDQSKIQQVRDWLHNKGLSYSSLVHLLYDDLVVATDWKIVVKYWDAFAWRVGIEMLALDSTKSWACSFHHEDAITFSSHKQAPIQGLPLKSGKRPLR